MVNLVTVHIFSLSLPYYWFGCNLELHTQALTHPPTHTHTSPQDRCNALFKQVHEEKHLKGRANDAVAAACLYIACRQEEVPRSFKEICAVSRHPKKEIGKCFKLITRQSNPILPGLVNTSDFMVRKLALYMAKGRWYLTRDTTSIVYRTVQ